MDNSSSRKILTIFTLLLAVGLAGTAIYVGYRLQKEEPETTEEAEEAEEEGEEMDEEEYVSVYELSSAWTKIDTGGTCTWENGCRCTISGGCTLVWYDCPEIYEYIEENGFSRPAPLCHTNKHIAGDVPYDPDTYHSIVSIIGQDVDCKYIQIDVYKQGESEGNNSWVLMYWDPDVPCTQGCGDRQCSIRERRLNRCELGETGNTWSSCFTNEVVEDCRSDCTWCGDGHLQEGHGEECDPGIEGSEDTCNDDCTLIVVPEMVTCGEECTSDEDCVDDGTVCNGDTLSDDRYPDGTCILEVCTEEDRECTDDGCDFVYPEPEPEPEPETLPETAIIDEKSDVVLIGIISVLCGVIFIKFDFFKILHSALKKLQSGSFAYLTAPISDRARTELTDKKKAEFEEEISEKIQD